MKSSLTQMSKSLWAKTPDSNGTWVSLPDHMRLAGKVARDIWRWLPHGTRELLSQSLGDELAEKLYVFLAAVHDIGKAIPLFQYNSAPHISEDLRVRVEDAGLPRVAFFDQDRGKLHHSAVSQWMLERRKISRTVAVVVGGHHGKPPSKYALKNVDTYLEYTGRGQAEWESVQDELFAYTLELAGLCEIELKDGNMKLTIPQQMLLTGLVIMADWIASGQEKVDLPERWEPGDDWERLGLYVFEQRFGFSANHMQKAVIDGISGNEIPKLMIIESAMGSGKTEAALAAVEIFAEKTGRGGVFFGLPTQATADGIFERFCAWIKRAGGGEPHSLFLAHGKSKFNKKYTQMRHFSVGADDAGASNQNDNAFVHDWLSGRRKGMLADFTVGTVDQLLMAGLRHRFLALRHLGLANKVVIIDEVHAYDAYMDSYLFKALRWLGMYGVPVIVMSATLPSQTRQKLIEAYVGNSDLSGGWIENCAYPLITYLDSHGIRQIQPDKTGHSSKVEIKWSSGALSKNLEELGEKLETLLADGGCAGVIVNTVARAQELAHTISERFGEDCVLFHSRFLSADRTAKEAALLEALGPPTKAKRPHRMIVVGTQVLEQSLDLDFDVLFTEVCPMDLLLQRIGRLHRHQRKRPDFMSVARCYVMGIEEFDSGSLAIYGQYMLLRTRDLLPDVLILPDDIPSLVQQAYDEYAEIPGADGEAYETAREEWQRTREDKENRAGRFQLADPAGGSNNLTGWLDLQLPDDSGKRGEASVRDGETSVEVIVLQKVDGKLRFLPWIEGGQELPVDRVPDEAQAFALAGCTVSLPNKFTANYKSKGTWLADRTIEELERLNSKVIPRVWSESHWLHNELFLVLNESQSMQLGDFLVIYNEKYGLETTKGD